MKKIISVALAVMMLVSLFAVSVFAEDYSSPSNDDYYTLVLGTKDIKGGNVSITPASVLKGETATVVAKVDDGYSFAGWTIEGDYELVSGDLNSAELVIRPLSDLNLVPSFKGQGGADKDTSATSPAMGYNFEAVMVVMAVVVAMSAAAVVYTGKKYYQSAK